MRLLNRNPLDLVERNFIISPVIELGCPRRFVVRDLLRDLEFTAVLEIRRDAGRAEGMIANPRFDAGRFRPSANDAVGVLLEEGDWWSAGPSCDGRSGRDSRRFYVLDPFGNYFEFIEMKHA
jgi:hypothetical protein